MRYTVGIVPIEQAGLVRYAVEEIVKLYVLAVYPAAIDLDFVAWIS